VTQVVNQSQGTSLLISLFSYESMPQMHLLLCVYNNAWMLKVDLQCVFYITIAYKAMPFPFHHHHNTSLAEHCGTSSLIVILLQRSTMVEHYLELPGYPLPTIQSIQSGQIIPPQTLLFSDVFFWFFYIENSFIFSICFCP